MNPEQEKARQSAEAEMKIYTPHRVIQEKCDNVAFDNAPVRIYERPYHPNQPTSPLGYPTGCETSLLSYLFAYFFMSHLKGARRVCLVLGCQHKLTGRLL